MKTILALISLSGLAVAAGTAVYQNDFQSAKAGDLPGEFLVLAGDFKIAEDGADKFIELPGAPLDTFGLLFGPSQKAGTTAGARFFGTKTGRKFPSFGISLGGAGGWRLQVSPAKKAIEIFKGDEPKASTPFEWASGTWTRARVQTRKQGSGWVVEGKAWPDGAAEPKEWGVKFETPEEPIQGRAAVWGSPYSGTAIRFDDLVIAPAE